MTGDQPPTESLIDLGCGIGQLSLELVQRGVQTATGVDITPRVISTAKQLAEMKKLGERCTFIEGDIRKTDLTPADTVIMDRVLHFNPDQDLLLRQVASLAKRRLIISLPLEGMRSRLAWLLLSARIRVRIYLLSIRMIDDVLRGEGFDRVAKWDDKTNRLTRWTILAYKRDPTRNYVALSRTSS